MIPYAKQEIIKKDIKAVQKVLQSDWLTQGPSVNKFEKDITNFCNVKYGISVNSATSALHISCLALGVSQNDRVWTSPNSFVASSNCALYCGAKIDFVDIDPVTYNISISALKKKLSQAKKINKLPKVVIPVHFAGQPCDMIEIYKLSKIYKFKVIEDASHALGASYKNKNKDKKYKIGSCAHSDITVFSFHPVKIITTGEGGMAVTNNQNLSKQLKMLRTSGITKNKTQMKFKSENPWYYEQLTLGYNYRMNDIQAALGSEQLKRAKTYITKRNKIAKNYNLAFKNLPITIPAILKENYSSFHLYVILLDEFLDHKKIFKNLRKKNVFVNLHYIPIHTHPYYQSIGFKWGDFPEAENYYRRAISLPMYPSLKISDQKIVIKTLKKCLNIR